MRVDPDRISFAIEAREENARTGRLVTPHGTVETPAFIPLATTAAVRGLDTDEVAALGYQMVLGNTFHLFLKPGHDRIAELGGLHRFMNWDRAIISDSGGFQIFSLAHGSVADEVKGRRGAAASHGSILEIAEEGVRFRSYLDGTEMFMGPDESMGVQAAIGSDIALAFDECTPYHADYDYTARSTERTHRWLDRCVLWHEENGPAGQALFGIVQGGTHENLRRISAERVATAEIDGISIGGTLGKDKDEMRSVLGFTTPLLPPEAPKHLLGIGEPDDLLHGISLGLDLFDCAVPTRLGRHGVALAPLPGARFRLNLKDRAFEADQGPIVEGCPCPACQRHTRAYLHYLARSGELTALRLLTIHNLVYLERLMAGARAAISAQRFAAYRDASLAGAAPWDA